MDELHIITAAHCCAGKQPHEIQVGFSELVQSQLHDDMPHAVRCINACHYMLQIRAGTSNKGTGGVIRYVDVIKQHEEFN